MPKTNRRRAAARPDRRSVKMGSGFWWMAGGAAVLIVIIIIGVVVARSGPRAADGALIGDHWHAPISFEVCGGTPDPRESPNIGVHSHGDSLVHIHPNTNGEAGRNANLQRYFDSLRRSAPSIPAQDFSISSTSIKVPGDPEYRNGDTCPNSDAPGRLRVLVNGEEVEDFLRYAPRDGDNIQVIFA